MNEEQKVMLDALVRPVIIGNKYGFSYGRAGITVVIIGVCTGMSKKRVNLNVIDARYFGRDSRYGRSKKGRTKPTSSVNSHKLFPIL